MDNREEKIVEYLAQHKNILWTGILVLGGGLVGLVLTYNPKFHPFIFSNFFRIIFFIIGFILFVSMIIGLLNTDVDMQKYLKKGNVND
ncbi:MAG: hypothetical protein WCY19_04090 [Candidatus Gastranaerophilaceae bacterium]